MAICFHAKQAHTSGYSHQNTLCGACANKMPLYLFVLCCVHTLCMTYITKTFLFASSSVGNKQLFCFVRGQGQRREQKHTTRNFVEFHSHSSLLTIYITTIIIINYQNNPLSNHRGRIGDTWFRNFIIAEHG